MFVQPNFSFGKYKITIFADGEFQHGKDWEVRKNGHKSNQEFLIKKIESNKETEGSTKS